MNLKTVLMAVPVAISAFGTGCSSACDDLQDCCEALNLGDVCEEYDDADEARCEAYKEAVTNPGTADIPEECQF
jgi:hypothetical protein